MVLSASSCRCKHLFLVTDAVTGFVTCAFHIVGGQWLGKTSPRPTPTHILAARASVHEDFGRDHDALHVHFALCDTGFNSSWNLRTRRCEVIRIGDRDYVGQIASSKSMRTPSAWRSGIWIHRQCIKPEGKHVRLHFGADSLLS